MSANVGKFGTLYLEKNEDSWRTLDGCIISEDSSGVTVLCIPTLEDDVDLTEQRVILAKASIAGSPPESGERVFIPIS